MKTFSEIQAGDIIFTLEKDRRSGYPVYDQARVIKVGSIKPKQLGNDKYTQAVELTVQDSISQVDIVLPSEIDEGIFSSIYYTTNINHILNEINNEKQRTLMILNNIDKYKTIVSECEKIEMNIQGSINHQEPQPPIGLSNKLSEDFSNFKSEVSKQMAEQSKLLEALCTNLGLNNNPTKS